MGRSNLLGSWGEALAAEFLKGKHYKIVAVHYYSRFGEIDIIAQNREYLVFAEVKLRKTDFFGEAREFVGAQKQKRLLAAATIWLQQNPTKLQPRFDVIEIYAPEGTASEHPEIVHLEDAFQTL